MNAETPLRLNLEAKLKIVHTKAEKLRGYSQDRRNAKSLSAQQLTGGVLRASARELAEIAAIPVPNPRPAHRDPNARFYTIAEMRRMKIIP